MITHQHCIQKLSLKLHFGSEKSAKSLQDCYAQTFKEQAIPALEQVFDKYNQPGMLIRIDKLSLDLGELPTVPSPIALKEKIVKQFERQLMTVQYLQENNNPNIQTLSYEAAWREAFAEFILSGNLPNSEGVSDFQSELNTLLDKEPEVFVHILQEAFRKGGYRVLLRIVHQFDENLLEDLADILLNPRILKLIKAFQVKMLSKSTGSGSHLKRSLWVGIMSASLTQYSDSQQSLLSLLHTFSRQLHSKPWDKQAVRHAMPDEWKALWENIEDEKQQLVVQKPDFDLQKDSGHIYCSNAGIVLLHPFLKQLFLKCELINVASGQFLDVDHQVRAVYLLHYLSTGEWDAPEYQLSIQKLLCGLELHMPIPKLGEPISEKLKNESSKMMKAAIRHWGALGNASPASLQDGFLQREAKLQLTPTGYLLQMERKTLDILMDKLPWNTSRIKLPWMKGMLRVEWA